MLRGSLAPALPVRRCRAAGRRNRCTPPHEGRPGWQRHRGPLWGPVRPFPRRVTERAALDDAVRRAPLRAEAVAAPERADVLVAKKFVLPKNAMITVRKRAVNPAAGLFPPAACDRHTGVPNPPPCSCLRCGCPHLPPAGGGVRRGRRAGDPCRYQPGGGPAAAPLGPGGRP